MENHRNDADGGHITKGKNISSLTSNDLYKATVNHYIVVIWRKEYPTRKTPYYPEIKWKILHQRNSGEHGKSLVTSFN